MSVQSPKLANHGTILEGKSIGSDQKSGDQCRFQLKDSICTEFLFCELEKDFALQGENCT
jgi:hypothetical protein